MRKSLILLLFAFGCTSAAIPPDPCSLLTKEEIFAVQDATFIDATKNLHTSGDVTVSQCYFRLPDASRSITLELTTARDLHELWEKQFEPGEEGERESGEKHAIEVKGLGRDAFWSGNRVSAALNVLTRGAIMRISIGGAGDQATKLEHAKALAKDALAKMKG
jgi:hypothetical protein